MNENQLAERMRAAVAGEPPLGFDPDELTDRAATRQRQRRTVFGAAAVTFAIAATVVGVVTSGSGSGVGSPPPVTPNCPQPMATLAPAVITRHLPGVALGDYDVECSQRDHQYVLPGEPGRIWLYYEPHRQEPELDFYADNEFSYHLLGEETVPGGVVRTYEEAPNSEDYWLRAAVWIGTDNTVVWGEVSGRGEPTATEEQLVALVSDPELTQ